MAKYFVSNASMPKYMDGLMVEYLDYICLFIEIPKQILMIIEMMDSCINDGGIF